MWAELRWVRPSYLARALRDMRRLLEDAVNAHLEDNLGVGRRLEEIR